jgi:dolichol-phosphate mannosyltransferase
MSNNAPGALLDPGLNGLTNDDPAQITTVVVPTYNERENIERLLETVFKLGIPDLRVIIVDDNSPDGTGQLAEELSREKYNGYVEVLHRPGKLGLGPAYLAGFKHALEKGTAFIVEMDADFSHDPATLKRFREAIEEADVVVGSRYVPGGSLDKRWTLLRRIISKGGSIYSRAILGLKVHDATAGFKMFRREVLERLPLDQIRSNGYCFQVEIAYLCQKNGFRVREVPIHFNERVAGVSKMSPRIALEAAWKVWQIRFRY